MLGRQTALEFPDAQHGHARRDFHNRRAAAHACRAAPEAKPSVSDAPPATNGGRVDMLERLATLRDRGAISDEEYQAEKGQGQITRARSKPSFLQGFR